MKKRVKSRATARCQASLIRGLFGCGKHRISSLSTLYFLAVSPGVNHSIPLSLSLPLCKRRLVVPFFPPHRALVRVK